MMDVKIDTDQECDLRNLVYTDDFGSNLRLEELVLLFGMENSEHEPEQFPALDYHLQIRVVSLNIPNGKNHTYRSDGPY